jgi:hypothetical protein
MKGTFPRGKKLYPAHYALLYFTKGEPKTFNRDAVRQPIPLCRHCGKDVKDYGGHLWIGSEIVDCDLIRERFVRNLPESPEEAPRLLNQRLNAADAAFEIHEDACLRSLRSDSSTEQRSLFSDLDSTNCLPKSVSL